MSRPRSSRRSTSLIRRLVRGLLGRNPDGADRAESRRLRFEPLEGRALMAADLASISGTVTLGGAADGALIELYEDTNANGTFEPGAGDALVDNVLTDAAGSYRFDRLVEGGYFVRQPAQTVGVGDLPLAVSDLITILPADAAGTAGTVIDDFDDNPASALTADDVTNPNSLAVDYAGALGGERDMIVTRTSGSAPSTVAMTVFNNELLFGSMNDAQGDFNVVYDGNDDNATGLAATGLGGVDLTQGGANAAIKVAAQANQAGTTARLRIYTDATNYSDLTIAVPNGLTPEDLVYYLDDFTVGAGAAGAATFSNVGAIDLLIETSVDGTDGSVTVLGAFAQNVTTQDFDNPVVDLVVEKSVDIATPGDGEEVTFTVTVTNTSATETATNVVLTDTFDFSTLTGLDTDAGAGNTFVVAGDQQTGTWTIPTLAPGAVATLTISGANNSALQRSNSIELTSLDQFDTDDTNNSDSEQVTPVTLDLALDKAVDVATPNNGEEITFTVTVTNTSATETATNVVLTDTFDFTTLANRTFDAGAGNSFVVAGNNLSGTWTIPTLAPGETATLIITGNNTSAAQRSNSISLTSLDQFDTSAANNSATEQITPNSVDLVVSKEVNDASPIDGQALTFTVTVTNSSATQTATNIVLTDTFDFTTLTGVTTNAGAGNTFVIAGDNQSGLWTIPTLAPGATATLTISGTNDSVADRTNTIELDSLDQFDTSAANNTDSVLLNSVELDLVVAKSVDDSTPNNGQAIAFTVTVTNSSATETATNVVLTDTFDFSTLTGVTTNAGAGNTFVIAGNNQSGVWTIPALAPGGVATLTIAGSNNSAVQRSNSISLTSLDQVDTNANNNADSEQITPNTLDLVVAKAVNDSTPNNGQSVTFTVTVTNSSATQTATNVVLTDTFDFGSLTGVTTNAGAGNTFVIAGNNQSGTWTIPTLAPGGVATLTITGNNNSAVQRSNAVAITSLAQFDTNANNNSDSEQITPNTLDLVVAKAVDDNTPGKNQPVTFTVTVTNTSATQTATNVVLTDTFNFTTLSNVTSNAGAGNTFTIAANNQSGTWTIPSLAPGAVATLTITGNNISAVQRSNSIALTSSDQFDTTAGNNSDSEQLTPVVANLSLTKVVNNATQVVGQNVVFTLTVANAGPEQATGVQVTDQLPAGLSFVSATASQGSYNSTTGLWTVGTIANGANATLTITARVNNVGTKTNVAQITAVDQLDPNSTPNNNVTTEDDQASVAVNPPARFSKRMFLAR